MLTVSLCMVVKDESVFIYDFLERMLSFVDEIIIVDTGSMDNTVNLIKKFITENSLREKIKLFHKKFEDDFAAVRNFSISKATKGYILVLDPDEYISDADLVKIKRLINAPERDGYKFLQKTFSNDVKSRWYRTLKDDDIKILKQINNNFKTDRAFKGFMYRMITRLFPNNKEIRFENKIHETVIPSLEKLKISVRPSNITVYNLTNLKDMAFIDNKNKLYLRLLSEEAKKNKKFEKELEEFKRKMSA